MDKNINEFLKLSKQLENSLGLKIINKIRTLNISYYIFMGNYKELKKALKTFEDPKIAIKLWTIENRDKLDAFHKEVIRLFHNYLASAKSLVEHTRIFAREMYFNTEFWDEYCKKISQQFDNSPLSHFIHDLRNYILHKGLPVTSTTLQFDKSGVFNNSILLSVDELRDWDKWSEKGKKYLNKLDKNIKMDKIINDYGFLVIEFYKWFGQRQDELHKEEFEKVDSLQQMMKILLDERDKTHK